ncbi:hypothetical protein B2G69_07515 [Methylorubrum zatmanii]|nr:Hpt domain-containing protein [Methylorubrum zatmanii]ARO54011.1 hypothetical protein B2G69_07515 [Methylorubrum zatmanii]
MPQLSPSPVEFDEDAYGEVRRFLTPVRLREVLGLLIRELDTSFEGDAASGDVLSRLRWHAHSLSSAAGMICCPELATACHELEAFDEAQVASEGVPAFADALGKVRHLADRPARVTERMLDEMEAPASLKLVCGRA